MRLLCHGYHHRRTDNRHDQCFEIEEILQLMWGREHEGKLHAPEHEVGDHLLGCYPGVFGEMIWDAEERGEDGTDYLGRCK